MPPRPLLAPDPRNDTTTDVPWAPSYLGPRSVTRTTYRAADGRPTVNGQPLTDEQLASLREYFGRLGDEDRDRFDIGTRLTERRLSGEEEERRERIRQAARAFDEDRRQYDLGRDDRRREFDLNYGLRQGDQQLDRDRFGADVLFRGAQLRGPLNWIQGDSYAQGVTNGLSPYLRALQTGTNVPYGGGTAREGNPTPLTVGTLANQMSGQTGNAPGGQMNAGGNATTDQYGRPRLSPDAQAAVDATAKVWREGIANRPLGWWENMTKGQQDAFISQSDYLGEDTQSGLEYLRRSRPGQGSALRA